MRQKSMRIGLACLLPIVMLLVAVSPAAAAIMTVTSTADEPDDDWGDGVCQIAPGGPCTLRGAVDEAWGNGNAEPDVINLPAGDFALSEGELSVTGAGTVKIAGVGAARTTIRQTGEGRVIHSTAPGGPLLLRDLTIRGGRLRSGSALPSGAGIRAVVGLDLDGVVVYDNRVLADPGPSFGEGGGVYAGLGVTIVRSRIDRNEAPRGGGLSIHGDAIEIRNSAIERNTAWDSNGGGMSVVLGSGPAASGRVVDSVIARNSAPAGQAGAIEGGGSSTPFVVESSLVHANTAMGSAGWVIGGGVQGRASNSTFSANRAALGGLTAGAIDRQFGAAPPLQLRQVTLSGNSNADGPATLRSGGSGQIDLKGTIVDGECNSASGFVVDATSLSSSATCGVPATPDLGLGPLADNGGPTMTHALTAGSPAIGAASECAVLDQRGAPRSGPPCDSGAYEFGAAPPPPPLPPPGVPDVDGDGIEDLDDACVEVAGDRADGCPTAVAAAPPATGGGAGGQGAPAPVAENLELPAFNVNEALLKRGRLQVAARVSPGAGGRCQVVLRGSGQVVRFQVPARVSLLAGSRLPRLTLRSAKLTGPGRLVASGRISPQARGRVRVTVLPTRAGSGEPIEAEARIERGRWRLSRRLAGLTADHRRVLVSYRGLKARGIGGAQFSRLLRGAASR